MSNCKMQFKYSQSKRQNMTHFLSVPPDPDTLQWLSHFHSKTQEKSSNQTTNF